MKIKVTEKHIKKGKKADPSFCPVALAFKETSDQFEFCRVYGFSGMRIDRMDTSIVSVPDEVVSFIEKFDNDNEVKPFEFEFEPEFTLC